MSINQLFVSYSRSITTEIRPLIELLREVGFDVWWDADIPKMADWWATIMEHIESAQVFLFVVSEKSVVSPYCLAELKYATDLNLPILPFIIDAPVLYTIPDEVTPNRNQWLEYDKNPAHLLSQLKGAFADLDLSDYPRHPTPRPIEPGKGTTLAKDFQQGVRLAIDGQFEEAKKRLRKVASSDREEWGQQCELWLTRIALYAEIADLADDPSTLEMAQQKWMAYRRGHAYSIDFDPLKIHEKFLSSSSKLAPSRRYVVAAVLLLVAIAGIAGLLSALSNRSLSTETPTQTSQPAVTPTRSSPTALALLPTTTTHTSATAAASFTPTSKPLSRDQSADLTDTFDALAVIANQTRTATQWTKTPTATSTTTDNVLASEEALRQQRATVTALQGLRLTSAYVTKTSTSTLVDTQPPPNPSTATLVFIPEIMPSPTLTPTTLLLKTATNSPTLTLSIATQEFPTETNTPYSTVAQTALPTPAVLTISSINAAKIKQISQWESKRVLQMAFSQDQQQLYVADTNGVWVYQANAFGTKPTRLNGNASNITCVAISPDGKVLAAGSMDHRVYLWWLPDGKELKILDGHLDSVWSVAISADGKFLASGSSDKTIRLWSLPDGILLTTLSGSQGEIRSIIFNLDNRFLVSGSEERTIRVWSLPDGKPFSTLSGPPATYSLAISKDGKILVAGGTDARLFLWSLPSLNSLAMISNFSQVIANSVALSADGKLLVAGGLDGTVRLWSVPSGKQLAVLSGHSGPVYSVLFGPDQGYILSTGSDDTLRMWGVPTN